MPNILINPNSGIIEFSTGVAGGAIFEQNITSGNRAVRFGYDNFGGINITSYVNITGSGFASGQDRFSVDGTNGRLFSVTDNLAGSLFSVNDIAGLPIIEAFDDNTVIMGAYNKNDFVLTGNSLGLGGLPNTGIQKLYVSGNIFISGSGTFSNNIVANSAIFINRPTVNNTGIMLSGDLNSATLSTSCGLTGNVLTTNSDVILPFVVKDDPRGWWNSSTNRWSPNIPGRYYVSYQINWTTGTPGNQINSQIRKNSNTVSLAQHQVPTGLNFTQNNTAIVIMNGTTGDYLDFTCYSSSTTPQYIIGTADGAWTHFEAFRLSN